MRKLIISDVHGNFPALKSVLSKESFDELIVLGDIVGYGPEPNECINLIRNFDPLIIRGNHEEALFDNKYRDYFNRLAKEAIEYTDGVITDENREFLKSLPYDYISNDFYLAHSSPYHPEKFIYLAPEKWDDNAYLKFSFYKMEREGVKVAFTGHTHYPGFFYKKNSVINFIPFNQSYDLILSDDTYYIFNVGSVGQPRNNNPEAQYVKYDTELKKFDYKTVKYDINETKKAFENTNLPKELYLRLFSGI